MVPRGNWAKLASLITLTVAAGHAGNLAAQEMPDKGRPKLSFRELVTDPEDGKLDGSAFLARGGFIPVPFVITEPALGKGLGVALAFFDYSGIPNGEDPTISALGGAATTNGSRIGFAARMGSLRGGDFKYQAALGGGSVNLTFFPNGEASAVEFNNEAALLYLEGRRRLVGSDWYLGPSLTLSKSKISPNTDGGIPLPPALTQELTQSALGVVLTYDTRDNVVTPRNGINFNLGVKSFSPDWGSDSDFVATKAFGSWFHSPDENWTFSAMALYEGTSGNAPFFMEPSIALRGVPYNRYQGNQVISSEVEVRRMINDRWSLLAFAGYGVTKSNGSSVITGDYDAFVYGGGFRYRIARKFGMDMGIDYAVGPEENILYITLGHAWSRHMK